MSTGVVFDALMEADAVDAADLVTLRPGTAVIAANVRRLRDRRNWSGADLAHEMQRIGVKWNRTTVAKLETNRRESVTVPELFALSLALGVPPVWLLIDAVDGQRTDVGGGHLDPWTTFYWITGQDYPGPGDEWPDNWGPVESAIDIGRRVGSLLQQLRDIAHMRESSETFTPNQGVDEFVASEKKALNALRRSAQTLIDRGYWPPAMSQLALDKAAEHGVDLPGRGGG